MVKRGVSLLFLIVQNNFSCLLLSFFQKLLPLQVFRTRDLLWKDKRFFEIPFFPPLFQKNKPHFYHIELNFFFLTSRNIFISVEEKIKHTKLRTTLNNGYLGSRNDEERSEMRYVMRIAEFSESSNLWTQTALLLSGLEYASLSIGFHTLDGVSFLERAVGQWASCFFIKARCLKSRAKTSQVSYEALTFFYQWR